jgi:hypothetical protein
MRDAIRWNDRLTILVSYFLVAGMMACVAVALVQLGQIFTPEWDGGFLVYFVFLITLEVMFSYRYLKNERLTYPDAEWFIYRLTEWVFILIMARAVLYARVGFGQFWTDISSGRESFLLNFFSDEYLVTIFIIFVFWLLSNIFADELSGLEGDEKLLKMERDSGISTERKIIRQRMVNLIFIIGSILVILTSLLRKDIQTRLGFSTGGSIGIYNVLAYFLLGLVLLSLTQFSILRARWGLDKIPVNRNLVTRWGTFTFFFLFGLVVLSAMLPTGYSLNLLTVLGQLVSFLGILFSIIVAILSLPLLFIAILLSWLSGGNVDTEARQQVQQFAFEPSPTMSQVPWIEFVKSLLFWLVFLGVIGFSVYYYLQVNKTQLAWLRKYSFIQQLLSFWNWMLTQVRGINQVVVSAIESGLKRIRAGEKIVPEFRPFSIIHPRNLTPRQRVMLFYMMMLKRGAKSGIPRADDETPYEYAYTLSSSIDDLELDEQPGVDIETVTDKFVEARYSMHHIDAEKVSVVQLAWDRVRRVLRQIRIRRE